MTQFDKWRQIARQLGPQAHELQLEAERLRREFEQGDRLAAFECCWRWQQANLGPATLPDWALNHLAKIAADYYVAGIRMIVMEPNWAGPDAVTPRALLDMPSKQRNKLLPSLDRVAELRGVQRRQDAWSWRAEHSRNSYVADFLDALQCWANEGGDPGPTATKIERLARRNRYRTIEGQLVKIVDRHHRLREEVLHDAGLSFRVAGRDDEMHWKTQTVRRRTKRVKRGTDN